MDHYTLLGVSYDANRNAISSAYRSRSLALHPDKLRTSSLSAAERTAKGEEYLRLQQAYHVLSNEEARKQYDTALKAGGLLSCFSSSSSSSAGGTRAPVLSCSEVALEDFDYDEENDTFSYPCRCGARYTLSEDFLLSTGIDLFPCSQCSSVLRVIFEWEPTEQQQEEAGAQHAQEPSTSDNDIAKQSASAINPNEMG